MLDLVFNDKNKINHLISTIGFKTNSNDDPYIIEFLLKKLLTDICEKFSISFSLISGAHITKAYIST